MKLPLMNKAESLIETIVAVTVFSLMFIAALTLTRISLKGDQALYHKFIAINGAEDGLNALINVRDTNRLRYASDTDNCWNKYNISDVADCSDGTADELQEGITYFLTQNTSGAPYWAWQIETVDSDDDGWISLYDINLDSDARTAETQKYLQSGITDSAFTVQEGKENIFRRTFTVAYNDDDTAYYTTVTVTWEEFGMERSIKKNRPIENIY